MKEGEWSWEYTAEKVEFEQESQNWPDLDHN